jgi:cell division protein FtsW (lipid II flippase)
MENSPRHELAARLSRRRERWAILLFAGTSLGAVVAGSFAIGAVHGASAFAPRELLAWVAGAILASAIVSLGFSRPLKLMLLGLAVAGLGASLINHGVMGVHRWLDIGPLHINIATLLLPALLVVLAADVFSPKFATLLGAGVVVVLWAQPDASQASAFAIAFVVLFGAIGLSSVTQRLILLAVLICAGLSWIRSNPLPPVPEVEGVVGLAWNFSPLIASAAIACLVIAAGAPLLLAIGNPNMRKAAIALTTYFALTAIAPFVGFYPVPLIGAGMSAIAGFWVGFGCLIALNRKRSAVQVRQPAENNAPNPITPDRRELAVIWIRRLHRFSQIHFLDAHQ